MPQVFSWSVPRFRGVQPVRALVQGDAQTWGQRELQRALSACKTTGMDWDDQKDIYLVAPILV